MKTYLFHAFESTCQLSVAEDTPAELTGQVQEELLRLDAVFDERRQESDLQRLGCCRAGEEIPVSADTAQLLRIAFLYSTMTHGAFTPAIAPLTRLWRGCLQAGMVPSQREIEQALSLISDEDIHLQAGPRGGATVTLRRSGQGVDLHAIRRSYAAEQALGMLRASGVRHLCLNLGGCISSLGSPLQVTLNNPLPGSRAPLGKITLHNQSLISRSLTDDAVHIGHRRWGALLDPRSGTPADADLQSVTLVGTTVLGIDALACAMLVLGLDQSRALLRQVGLQAVLVTRDGQVITTSPELLQSRRSSSLQRVI